MSVKCLKYKCTLATKVIINIMFLYFEPEKDYDLDVLLL